MCDSHSPSSAKKTDKPGTNMAKAIAVFDGRKIKGTVQRKMGAKCASTSISLA